MLDLVKYTVEVARSDLVSSILEKQLEHLAYELCAEFKCNEATKVKVDTLDSTLSVLFCWSHFRKPTFFGASVANM